MTLVWLGLANPAPTFYANLSSLIYGAAASLRLLSHNIQFLRDEQDHTGSALL